MILRNAYWFDILPSRPNRGLKTPDGKWLYFGPTHELHAWLERIDRLVEQGKIRSAKIARKLPEFDPFPDKPCVMCAFTTDDPQSKENARQVLKAELNIDVTVWKSDEQTRRDWDQGGWLQLEANFNRIRRQVKWDGLDHDARSRLGEMAEQLQRAIDAIKEPSRLAEIEASGATELIGKLVKDLRRPEVSADSIYARLDEIQAQLSRLVAAGHAAVPQAAALVAANENPDQVFVIMPFAPTQIDTFDAICRGVARASSALRATRVDEVPGAIQITDEIKRMIRVASLIICDLSEERPNVYYELGLANGLAKQVICIARRGTIVHFDVYGLKILFFDTYRSLEEQLEREIRTLLEVEA